MDKLRRSHPTKFRRLAARIRLKRLLRTAKNESRRLAVGESRRLARSAIRGGTRRAISYFL